MKLTYQQRAEIDLCHAYLNALGAACEGKFVLLSMLGSFMQDESYDEEVKEARTQLEMVTQWQNRMWRGNPLLFGVDEDDFSEEVIIALDLLEQVKTECAARADIIEKLREKEEENRSPEAQYLLTALLAYQAHSRYHYIRGLVKYGEVFGPREIAENWRAHLLSCEESIGVASRFFDQLMDGSDVDANFCYQLMESTLLLPGIFRCQVHDINQIYGIVLGQFSFFLAEFSPDEAAYWDSHGFSPRAAGYWRAYDLSPEEVVEWNECGFLQPGVAAAWRCRGFDPDSALLWSQEGYSARQSRFFASLGCETPYDAARVQELGN